MSHVPKLRFKEFSGEWKEKRLNSFSFRSAEKNRDNNINLVFTNSAVKGIVNQQDYFDKDIANQNNLEGYYIVNKDDFIYNPRISNFAPVGPLNRNHLNDKGIMSPLYTIFKMDEKKINLDFIEKFFKTAKWYKYMNSVANYGARSDRMNITNNDFFKMPIFVPSKPEQEKIASFLTSVDTKIEQLTKKEALLQEYKKGVMNKIFNQEIRFKDDDGREFCEWRRIELNEFLIERSTYPKDLLPIYSLTIQDGIIPKSDRYERAFLVKEDYEYKAMIKDDFAFNPMNLRFGALARHKEEISVMVSKYYNIFYCNEKLNPYFAELYFTNYNSIQHYNKMATGILEEKKRVHFKEFLKFKFPFPCLKEQIKISNFLSSINTKIKNTKNELEKIKEFKKALLQQMFV